MALKQLVTFVHVGSARHLTIQQVFTKKPVLVFFAVYLYLLGSARIPHTQKNPTEAWQGKANL
jgi:hypothetical protein